MKQNKAQEWAGSVATNPKHSAYKLVRQISAIENDMSLLGKLRSRTPSTKNSPIRRPSPLMDYSNYVPVRKQSITPSRDLSHDLQKSQIDFKFKELQDKTNGLDKRSKRFEAEMSTIKRKIQLEMRSLMQLKVRRGDLKLSKELHTVLGKLGHCFLRVGFQQLKLADEMSLRRERRLVRKMEQYRAEAVFKRWRDYYLKETALEAALTQITAKKLAEQKAKKVLQTWRAVLRTGGNKAKLSKTISFDSRANGFDLRPIMTPKTRQVSKVTVASLLRVSPSWLSKVKQTSALKRRYNSQIVSKNNSPVPSSTSTSQARSPITKAKGGKPKGLRSKSAIDLADSFSEQSAVQHYHRHLLNISLSELRSLVKAKNTLADNHFYKTRLTLCMKALKPELSTESTDSAYEPVVRHYRLIRLLPLLQAWKSYAHTSKLSKQRERRRSDMQIRVGNWLNDRSFN